MGWPTRSQLLFSYFTVTSENFQSFSKNDFTKKKRKIHIMNFGICFKKIDSEIFFFFKKIPTTKVSNLTWASNPWPTRSQLLFSYFTVTPENFLSFSKNRFPQKKKKKKKKS